MSELLIVFGWLVVAAVLIYLVFYALGRAAWPEPVRTVATVTVSAFVVILCLIALVAVLQRAGLMVGL
jgi:hypothetical protein